MKTPESSTSQLPLFPDGWICLIHYATSELFGGSFPASIQTTASGSAQCIGEVRFGVIRYQQRGGGSWKFHFRLPLPLVPSANLYICTSWAFPSLRLSTNTNEGNAIFVQPTKSVDNGAWLQCLASRQFRQKPMSDQYKLYLQNFTGWGKIKLMTLFTVGLVHHNFFFSQSIPTPVVFWRTLRYEQTVLCHCLQIASIYTKPA